jgi:hypothetical protein
LRLASTTTQVRDSACAGMRALAYSARGSQQTSIRVAQHAATVGHASWDEQQVHLVSVCNEPLLPCHFTQIPPATVCFTCQGVLAWRCLRQLRCCQPTLSSTTCSIGVWAA